MTVTVASVGTIAAAGGGDTTPGVPSGIASTDIINLFAIWIDTAGATGSATFPAGFVQRGATTHVDMSAYSAGIWGHVCAADSNGGDRSADSGSYTIALPTNFGSGSHATRIAGSNGWDSTAGIAITSVVNSAAALSVPSITTSAANEMALVSMLLDVGSTRTTPAGYTSETVTDASQSVFHAIVTSAGAIPAGTSTPSGSVVGQFALSIAYAPAPTVPDTMAAPTVDTPSHLGIHAVAIAPFNGGAAITDYSWQYSSDGGSTWTSWSHSPSTSLEQSITGLSAGTYILQVAAVNSVGTGSWSASSSSITVQDMSGVLLLEDGTSKLLLEDGTSYLLLESGAGASNNVAVVAVCGIGVGQLSTTSLDLALSIAMKSALASVAAMGRDAVLLAAGAGSGIGSALSGRDVPIVGIESVSIYTFSDTRFAAPVTATAAAGASTPITVGAGAVATSSAGAGLGGATVTTHDIPTAPSAPAGTASTATAAHAAASVSAAQDGFGAGTTATHDLPGTSTLAAGGYAPAVAGHDAASIAPADVGFGGIAIITLAADVAVTAKLGGGASTTAIASHDDVAIASAATGGSAASTVAHAPAVASVAGVGAAATSRAAHDQPIASSAQTSAAGSSNVSHEPAIVAAAQGGSSPVTFTAHATAATASAAGGTSSLAIIALSGDVVATSRLGAGLGGSATATVSIAAGAVADIGVASQSNASLTLQVVATATAATYISSGISLDYAISTEALVGLAAYAVALSEGPPIVPGTSGNISVQRLDPAGHNYAVAVGDGPTRNFHVAVSGTGTTGRNIQVTRKP